MSRSASGFRAWVLQRLSAIYMAVFLLYLFGTLLFNPLHNSQEWLAWISRTPFLAGLLLFVFLLLVHAWIGIRDVIIDYFPHPGLRIALLSLIALSLVYYGFWALKILIATPSLTT